MKCLNRRIREEGGVGFDVGERRLPCFAQFSCSKKETITDRRNRLGTDSVEFIECLHHWLSSGTVPDVLTAMNNDGLIVIDDSKKDCDFSGVDDVATFVNDFVSYFHVFVDLSLIVCSIAIRNIKTRWITCENDELWGRFVD